MGGSGQFIGEDYATMEDGGARSESTALTRYAPDEPLPPYSYVNGRFPHPIRDPAGHSFGVAPAPCATPDPDRWRECRPYLRGVDLFNHGYYWEAHEVWEGVWNACGRTGPAGDFFKGLIKLAAAGVKAREGRPEGRRRHARRAAELFKEVAGGLPTGVDCYFGLSLARLVGFAAEAERDPGAGNARSEALSVAPVEIVFAFVLLPGEP